MAASSEGSSEADHASDQDDVYPTGPLLVDLENLSDGAVLPVGRQRAGVLQLEAVLGDPPLRGVQRGDELLGAYHEDNVCRAPRVGSELAARGRGDDERSVASHRVHAADDKIG